MSRSNLLNGQQRLVRRTFLRLVGCTTAGATLAACVPNIAPDQSITTDPAQEEAAEEQSVQLQTISVNGVDLHYIDQGEGEALVYVHGGMADYRQWLPQMARFTPNYRVIAYSQRYYYPNQNLPIIDDYTTLVDAQDLAAFVRALDLGPSHIVGYSSGAYMALAMALEEPELVRTLVLAEPPILHWAEGVPGGDAVLAEFMTTFWEPVGEAFRQGDRELALRLSMKFFIGSDILDELPAEVRQPLEESLDGWEAFTTSHDCFPMIEKERVAQMQMPILLLMAEHTLAINGIVNDELKRLLPAAPQVTLADSTHEMWTDQPNAAGEAMLQFLQVGA